MHERPNPFYRLLLVVSVAFVVTALAYAVVPWQAQPEWLKQHGWRILLTELAGIILFGLMSMVLDRIRSRRESGVRSQESGIRSQESGTRGQKSEQPLGD